LKTELHATWTVTLEMLGPTLESEKRKIVLGSNIKKQIQKFVCFPSFDHIKWPSIILLSYFVKEKHSTHNFFILAIFV